MIFQIVGRIAQKEQNFMIANNGFILLMHVQSTNSDYRLMIFGNNKYFIFVKTVKRREYTYKIDFLLHESGINDMNDKTNLIITFIYIIYVICMQFLLNSRANIVSRAISEIHFCNIMGE